MLKYLIFNSFTLQNEKKVFSIIEVPTFGPSHTQGRTQPQRWTHPQVTINPSKNGLSIQNIGILQSLFFAVLLLQFPPTIAHTPLKINTPTRIHPFLEIAARRRPPPPPLTERYTLGALNGHPETNEQSTGAHYTSNYLNPQGFSSRQPVIYSTPKDVFTGIPLKTFTATNQQLVAGLTKKNLLKCHLHVFNGDVPILHS